MERPFFITVDTEGDNQWKKWHGETVTTQNAQCIPRFQELCEEFWFKPVYFLTYEMVMDISLCKYLRKKVQNGLCEVGMHLHGWNSPPAYELERLYEGNPYITEFPEQIMYEKMELLTKTIAERIEVQPVSHRAGRWASNSTMFRGLENLGYVVDSSIVSGWNASSICGQTVPKGFDYRKAHPDKFWISENLLEVPMIVQKKHDFRGKTIRNRISRLLKGRDVWLRPAVSDENDMKELLSTAQSYAMLMIHSSELLPGGSPYFQGKDDVEREYTLLRKIFSYAQSISYSSATLKEYYDELNSHR